MTPRQQAYVDAVARAMEGMLGVSTGYAPGCQTCADAHGVSLEEFRFCYERGETPTAERFSWSPCELCGCPLGGNREPWHWIIAKDRSVRGQPINHGAGACTSCVLYLGTAEVPEDEHLQWIAVPETDTCERCRESFPVDAMTTDRDGWYCSPCYEVTHG